MTRALGACLLCAGLIAAATDTQAGQAEGTFKVVVQVLPADATAGCSIATGTDAIRIACAPPATPIIARAPSASAGPVAGAGAATRDGSFLEVLQPQRELLPEDVLVPNEGQIRRRNEDSSPQAFLGLVSDSSSGRMPPLASFGEYSARAMVAEGFEYLEMTVSW